MIRKLLVLSVVVLPPVCASAAEMTCAQLGTYLATLPHISQYVPPATPAVPNPAALPLTQLIPAAGANTARCEANFIYSDRGGPAAGYAVGQNQRIGIRVGLPPNVADGGSGRVQGAWNGKVRNIGGGGLQGSLSATTPATNTGYVGSNTDTGHPGGSPTFAVIQDTHELNYGTLDDFLVESIHQQYKWALALTEVYYGQKATRNYWDGCSTGGREGLSMALHFGEDFDGFLTGAPANFHTRLQVATVWPWWVQKEITGGATGTLTQAKMNAANASAVAACDAQDGVSDGVLGDPRACKFDAKANICGMPGAPATNCLTPQEADAVNRIWDGPRNDRGKRIWFAFGRGANAGVTNAPPFGGPGGSLGIFTWSHMDNNYDFTGQPLSQFDDETELATNEVAPYSDIMSTELDKVRKRGGKILMWHGGADQLIPWRQSVHYYDDAAYRYKGYDNLAPWFRFFLAPGVTHCGGGVGPQPQGLFDVMVNWVETGVAPNSILSSSAAQGSRPMCPYPQTAIFKGGDSKVASNWVCGGDLKNKETVCDELVTKYQKETLNSLDTNGLANPAQCNANSNVP
ncbi:MAG: tannase/feruloyl esterase family alpha/beta hydrolase, partial [Betaproteobacteria bacterium]|nr:tannase/feruloyl esterase family alpha/beta hydrolase [Betaproteobacteria bacterium]